MWHQDPDLTMMLERERQNEMIRNHQQHQAARRAAGNKSMIRTILGLVGDAMVNTGERLRRRSQAAQQMPNHYNSASTDVLAF